MSLKFAVVGVAALFSVVARGAVTAEDCGDLANHHGPFDYRVVTQADRDLVENYHFTPKVAALKQGETSEIGADIAYLLRVFPNHPRGLYAMAELGRRQHRAVPAGAGLSIECWFERALRFRPDDGRVRLVLGIELLKDGKKKEAVEQLELAMSLIGEDANAHYNLGLAYFDLGNYDLAREHAKKAYAMGFNLPGLQRKLESKGKWQ